MVHIPFWLREPLRRLVQYLGVFVASLPAGIVYLLLATKLGDTPALVVALPLGLLSAYFAWNFIGKRVLANDTTQLSIQVLDAGTSIQYAVYDQATTVAGGIAAVVLATCVITTQVATALPSALTENNSDTKVV